jgi:TonB-dependent starch-binding outer membrane protein SusC
MKKRLLMIIGVLFVTIFQIIAQERVISGKVVSSEDGSALPGVSVTVKGTTRGVTTDANGAYKISVPSNAKLAFSFVGFTSLDVSVGTRTELNMVLKSAATDLDEVVIVGYGTQAKSKATYSVSTIKSDAIKDIPVTGLDQAMQGRAAGVMVTSSSGTPGGGVNVRLRGGSSITASNEPLYVVDGIPISTGSFSQLGFGNQTTNALNDIAPTDIESIDILKDAAASAIYGSRAANGVVLITTKKGKAGKTQITFNYSMGNSQKYNSTLKGISGAEETKLLQEAVINRYGVLDAKGGLTTPAFGTGTGVWNSPADVAAFFFSTDAAAYVDQNPTTSKLFYVNSNAEKAQNIRTVDVFSDPTKANNTSWQDQIFRTAPIKQYDVSARGGNDKTTFFASGSIFDQSGIIIGSDYKRYTGRINVDNQVSKNVKIGASLGYTYGYSNRINNDNNIYGVLSAAILMASDIPVRFANGSYGKDNSSSVENPVAGAFEPYNQTTFGRLLGSLSAEVDIIKGLKFRSAWNIDQVNFKDDRFLPNTLNAASGVNGLGIATSGGNQNLSTQNYFTYNHSINNLHNITLTAGADYQTSAYDYVYGSATGFPGNSIKRVSAGATKTDAGSDGSSWGLVSYYGRLGYDFDGKYLIQGVVRADASSRFGKDFQWGYFPSVSGAWRVSKERFMNEVAVISDLKIRASYGITGNSEIPNFGSRGLLGSGNAYQLQAALTPNQIPNPGLKWETTTTSEVGLDLGLFKNRITLSAGYYSKYTKDLLLNVNIPATSGFTTILQNFGEMENKGFEFTLSTENVKTKDFTWTSNFNISANENRVRKIFGNAFGVGFGSWIAQDEALGSFRGYKVDKIFQNQEEIDAANAAAKAGGGTVYQSTLTKPGDIKFVDINGDGKIDAVNDQVILGSAQPKFFGSFTNDFTFKGFDLRVFLQFVQGNKLLNYTRNFSEGMNSVFGQTDAVLNRWTPTNTNTDVPRAVWGDPNSNRRVSDRFIEDGSYVRLKNISFGYTLPKTLTSRVKVDRIRFYVQAQNLLTFTNYKGMDPEVSTFNTQNTAIGGASNTTANGAQGTDFLTFPQAKTYTFGVNIGF